MGAAERWATEQKIAAYLGARQRELQNRAFEQQLAQQEQQAAMQLGGAFLGMGSSIMGTALGQAGGGQQAPVPTAQLSSGYIPPAYPSLQQPAAGYKVQSPGLGPAPSWLDKL